MRSMFERAELELAGGPFVPPYPGPYTIPFLVDDVKQLPGFNMTRGMGDEIDSKYT